MPKGRSSPKAVERLALAGLTLATVGLGAVAFWSAIVTQNSAAGLSEAGVQTSGHLRAVQALTAIDRHTDSLGESFGPSGLAELRQAERILADALARMERGNVIEARRIAREARPKVQAMEASIESLLVIRRTRDPERLEVADDVTDETVEDLQLHLTNPDFDPSSALITKLEAVTVLERTVLRTTFVLVPLALGFVGACAWLLRVYRRRSEAAMREAVQLSSHEARTDQLTGLANRRALLEELERRIGSEQPFTLALADLDGFKQYNDTYGHAAGDALLRRLASKLGAACASRGTAARLGGDEFCVLLPTREPVDEVEQLVCNALSEEGEGFRVTSGCGVVRIPEDARDIEAALRLADTRMYAAKIATRPTVEYVMSRVLVQMLDERHPGLGDHVEEVSHLAESCARELGLEEDEVEQVRRAAELHDIGKLAIPESILNKPGPLTGDEWDFIRRHTVIGERVLALVPALQRAAALVRSSHERWDGSGYPDRLAGDQIPVGARIVAVADAFSAMTEDRPHAAARSVDDALAELVACAGTQFDPVVVEAFVSVQQDMFAAAAIAV